MAEQATKTFLQRCMSDFVTGASWVPAAPGPTGHARPGGASWSDSPVVKWALDLVDWLDPARDNRAVLRAAGKDPVARMEATLRESVIPALEAARDALVAEGYEVTLDCSAACASLAVTNYNGSPLEYTVTGRVYAQPAATLADIQRGAGDRYAVIEIRSRGRMRSRRPGLCSRRALRRDCLHEMRKALLW